MAAIAHTPSWLSRPSPAYSMFSSLARPSSSTSTDHDSTKIERTIAKRGTEVFVAVGNEIRWSDFVLLRDKYKDIGRRSVYREHMDSSRSTENEGPPYRSIRVPTSRRIKQLVVSPRGDYMAAVTSHTVHILVLPEPTHLHTDPAEPLRVKTYQLGPTAHVLEQAPIASVLWHPLGYKGACLVTVTADALVRVWEITTKNRYSFDQPSLAVDLKKLVNATSTNDDLSVANYGVNSGFSPDSVEMEVASASFGAVGQAGTNPWASCTLWFAMKQGDVYALCPLLPSRIQCSSSFVGDLELTTTQHAAVAKGLSIEAESAASLACSWVEELLDQDPFILEDDKTFEVFEVYTRPTFPGPVAKLQGPFAPMTNVNDGDSQIIDMCVVAPSGVTALDMDDEEETSAMSLMPNLVCLTTNVGDIHVCLDTQVKCGMWLSESSTFSVPTEDPKSENGGLVVLETLMTGASDLTFTALEANREILLVTHREGVNTLSLSPWTSKLGAELTSSNSGANVRIDVLLNTVRSVTNSVIKVPSIEGEAKKGSRPTPSSICIDENFSGGPFVFALFDNQPYSAVLGEVDGDLSNAAQGHQYAPDEKDLVVSQPRASYQAPQTLWKRSSLPHFAKDSVHSRHYHVLEDRIKLSPFMLEIMTDAHRIVSEDTQRLALAAADLFRRCERLQDEFVDQIRRMRELSARVSTVSLDAERDSDDAGSTDGSMTAESRLEAVIQRQKQLEERRAALGTRLATAMHQTLSQHEKTWKAEIGEVAGSLGIEDNEDKENEARGTENGDAESDGGGDTYSRFESVNQLFHDLSARASSLKQSTEDIQKETRGSSAAIPQEYRRNKTSQVLIRLQRETALINAVQDRLERLRTEMLVAT